MDRLLKDRADLRDAWGKMPGEKKGDFLHENQDRFGEDLKGMFEIQVVRINRQLKLTDFEASGEYKDEEDIKEFYKNKHDVRDWIPTNAQTIKAQGRTMYSASISRA